MGPIASYARWLHTGWPAGRVEPGPEVAPDGSTAVRGLFVAGDLAGVPLLKLAADSGARVVRTISAQSKLARAGAETGERVVDLAIVGASVAGMSAALEARARGLAFTVLEADEPFATVARMPARKPIYLYPTDFEPAGALRASAAVKEPLLEELLAQTRDVPVRRARVERVVRDGERLAVDLEGGERVLARHVILAIGRSGDFRKLGVPGEDLEHVHNRLHDPAPFAGRDVLVVGGGDNAVETAAALAEAGARVTLSHRSPELVRPKPDNLSRLAAATASGPASESPPPGRVRVLPASRVRAIRAGEAEVELRDGQVDAISAQSIFTMIGREPPLAFLRRCGVPIRGEWTASRAAGLTAFLALCTLLYLWKGGGAVTAAFRERGWFPFGLGATLGEPGFWFSSAYCVLVTLFGLKRIARRRTPYVSAQTWTLIAFQVLPLWLVPWFVLPWLGQSGVFDHGLGRDVADALFPVSQDAHGREYWRSFGFVLAWPLFVWNVFTEQPLGAWLAISLVQTFVLIPLIVWKWGKGAYCGWVCSCGALAETLGDAHRDKMPHGPAWNRLNLLGQAILVLALSILALRVVAWTAPESGLARAAAGASGWLAAQYSTWVDLLLAGILGLGLYFWFSGRTWCRFACPLAALMHVYARFTRFRILADKKKCISCNVCTTNCHQGIDVMAFAQRGLPMADPQCVRCSACVETCPTGVLEFGEVDRRSGREARRDRLAAARAK